MHFGYPPTGAFILFSVWRSINVLRRLSKIIMPDGTLATIPADLLIPILSQVCLDGGKMGCSLSLVSRALRAFCVNTGVDLTSASICGRHKLKRFLIMVRRRRRRETRRVQSLFLFSTPPPFDGIKEEYLHASHTASMSRLTTCSLSKVDRFLLQRLMR